MHKTVLAKKISAYFFALVGLAALVGVWLIIQRLAPLKNARPLTNDEPPIGYQEYPDEPAMGATAGLLTIPELGISIPATGVLKDLVYSRFPTDREYESSVYGLSTRSLLNAVKVYGDGDCRPQRGALGLLQLSETGETLFESTIVVKLGTGKYLTWESPQDRCVASEPGYALWRRSIEEIRVAVRGAKTLAGPGGVTAPISAGVLNIQRAQVGDRFGVWTVKENNIQPKEIKNPFTGAVSTGPSGQIMFDGSLTVKGRYSLNDLEGGIVVYPDAEYLPYLPTMASDDSAKNLAARSDGSVPIAVREYPTDIVTGETREITIELTGLAFQQVFCEACDPWQGFYIQAKVVPDQY